MDWKNKNVLITGASSGIGQALAKEAVKQGAKVGLIARREDLLKNLVAELQAKGGTAGYQRADVADRASLTNAIFALEQELGPVDILIANAGVGSTNTPDNLKLDEAEALIKVNLLGVIYSIGAVLPKMLERKSGQIAAVSSLASYKGLPGAAAYCASKAGVNAYMESLRIQLRRSGVRFTTICPGFIKTPMTETNKGMMFVLEADEAARRMVAALQSRRKIYNFPWATTRLTKLARFLPDWMVAQTVDEHVGGQGAETVGKR
jgi:short-subunit dehydrogenase